jgi:hypothetical protein
MNRPFWMICSKAVWKHTSVNTYGAKLTQPIWSLFTPVNGQLVRRINLYGLLGQFVENPAKRRKIVFSEASLRFAS